MLICAVILVALTVSALTAVAVDTAYQAVITKRWAPQVPPMAVVLSVLAVVAGASIGSNFV